MAEDDERTGNDPAEQQARLSHEVTIARTPDVEQTMVREGGPQARPQAPAQARPEAPAAASPGHRIELHTAVEAESILAEGGMAVVYRARDRALERSVAMKVLKPGSSATVRAGFEREAKLMARLDHPGIVSVHGLAGDEDSRTFTMKLVEGRTIADIIDSGRPPRGRALTVMLRSMLRMCETLAYAHDRGVIHRDLKPENVMLGRYGECFIMDWGVALERGPAGARAVGSTGDVIGTPAFMAPEQAYGRLDAIDPRTDVHGLGAILYYILTGTPPYAGNSLTEVLEAVRAGRVTPPDQCVPNLPIPARLHDIVTRALQPDPAARYESAMAMHDAIEQFLFTGDWFTRRRFSAGELIVREGEQGDRAYIIESGECEVFRATEAGEVSIRKIGPGEVIGEIALFTESGRTASIRALTEIALLEVTRDALERELPAGSWTRLIVDTLAERFVSIDRNRRDS